MRRRWPIALSALTLGGLAATGAQQPAFRSTIDSVAVDVSVYDGKRPVDGLTAADFEILDNGVPQTVLDASFDSVPIDVTLVLDVSGSVQGSFLRALVRAASDVGRRLRPDDRATLVTFNERVRELIRDVPGDRLIAATAGIRATGDTSLYDALGFSLIAERRPGRRQMMIALTDGWDTASVLDPHAVVDAARRANTAIFFVATAQPNMGIGLRTPILLSQLASLTGGAVQEISGSADLSAPFLRAFDEFRTSYVVRYIATGVARGGWHEITVRVKRPANATVRARKWYFGGRQADVPAGVDVSHLPGRFSTIH